MGRLRPLSGKQVCEILERHGFTLLRQRGSHAILQRTLADSTTTVPVPLHPELRTGTLMSIVRQSGIGREPFEF